MLLTNSHACASQPLPLSEYSAEQTQRALHKSVFMASLSTHPSRDLLLSREQHCKLLPGVADIQADEVAQWTVDEVSGAALGSCDGRAQLLRISLRHRTQCIKVKIHS